MLGDERNQWYRCKTKRTFDPSNVFLSVIFAEGPLLPETTSIAIIFPPKAYLPNNIASLSGCQRTPPATSP
jgi:hypothetical protein